MSILRGIEPLTNYFHPEKLADLSAVSFMAGILHQKLIHMRQDTALRIIIYSSPDLDQIDPIPKSIRSTLNELIPRTKKSWTEWWRHHHRKVFFESQNPDNMIDWFDDLVWLSDGTINYEQTARKILSGEKLTDVQKFQLACAYCFIDDVERLKQTLTNDEMKNATKGCLLYPDEFLNYWSCKLDLSWTLEYYNLLDAVIWSRNEDYSKYKLESYDEWPAINFLLNQLHGPERSEKIKHIIKLYEPRLIWLLLPTLSDVELQWILCERGLRIMETLVINRLYFDFTLSVWNHTVHMIDNSELAQILRYINDLDYERSYVNDLLWKMWLVTSESQKKFIVDERVCDFAEGRMCQKFEYGYYSPNFPLVFEVLSRSIIPEHRYGYWKNYWDYLVIGQLDHRGIIERIMKLCFDDEQKIQEFKKTTMIEYENIAINCKLLLRHGRANEVQTYLEYCSLDSQLIRDWKKRIINEIPKDELFDIFLYWYQRSDEAMDGFNRYLKDIFSERSREKFLYKMVSRGSKLKKISDLFSSSEKVRDVIKFIETFVSCQESLIKVKLQFFDRCDFSCGSSIGKSERLDLLAWCLNGDRALVENFKKIRSLTEEEVARKRRKHCNVYTIFVETYKKEEL